MVSPLDALFLFLSAQQPLPCFAHRCSLWPAVIFPIYFLPWQCPPPPPGPATLLRLGITPGGAAWCNIVAAAPAAADACRLEEGIPSRCCLSGGGGGVTPARGEGAGVGVRERGTPSVVFLYRKTPVGKHQSETHNEGAEGLLMGRVGHTKP